MLAEDIKPSRLERAKRKVYDLCQMLEGDRIGLIAFAVWFLAHNTLENMRVRGIQSGFGFLTTPAGFDIGESLIPYDSLDPYWKAFLVGSQHAARGDHRHRADDAARNDARRGALLAQRAGARTVLRLCRAVPQHPGPASVADVVPAVHGMAAGSVRAGEFHEGVLPQQGRLRVSGAGLGPGAGSRTGWRHHRRRAGLGLPAVDAAPLRTHRPGGSLFWVPVRS
jgi:hypothetical protein